MIGGSQDNGGFHYSGAPIWKRTWVAPGVPHNTMEGDGVLAQIDPFNGYVHYYGTGPEGSASRSDNAGKMFDAATWTFFPGTQWWSPFYCDPNTPGVIFTGGTRIWRSAARGNPGTWNEITTDLGRASTLDRISSDERARSLRRHDRRTRLPLNRPTSRRMDYRNGNERRCDVHWIAERHWHLKHRGRRLRKCLGNQLRHRAYGGDR
jgi:hypothetical protein